MGSQTGSNSPGLQPSGRAGQRARFWVEAALGGLSAALLSVTLLVPDWIEVVFGVDPDQHNGSLEWAVTGLLFTAAVACGVLARREWLRPQLGPRG